MQRSSEAKSKQDTNESWFNTRNHSLRLYTDHSGQSIQSGRTDLSDVGLCSFNVNETAFNMLLCFIFLDDK